MPKEKKDEVECLKQHIDIHMQKIEQLKEEAVKRQKELDYIRKQSETAVFMLDELFSVLDKEIPAKPANGMRHNSELLVRYLGRTEGVVRHVNHLLLEGLNFHASHKDIYGRLQKLVDQAEGVSAGFTEGEE